MIKIHIRRNEAQQIVACSINGHAGYDEHGYDIVCAAVSVLSCTAILGLQSVAEQQGIYENSSGECTIELQGAITEKGQAIFWQPWFLASKKLLANMMILYHLVKHRR